MFLLPLTTPPALRQLLLAWKRTEPHQKSCPKLRGFHPECSVSFRQDSAAKLEKLTCLSVKLCTYHPYKLNYRAFSQLWNLIRLRGSSVPPPPPCSPRPQTVYLAPSSTSWPCRAISEHGRRYCLQPSPCWYKIGCKPKFLRLLHNIPECLSWSLKVLVDSSFCCQMRLVTLLCLPT